MQKLIKRTVWARNNQLTISGHTPLELAHGRRPPDLLDYQTASPEELTTDPLTTDKIDRLVRKLALQSHIEARQAEDLRLDLAKMFDHQMALSKPETEFSFGTRTLPRSRTLEGGSVVELLLIPGQW